MMKRALAATWLALTATAGMAAQPQGSPCLSASEVSDLAQVILPEAIGAAGVACASVLPASAAIRQTGSPMLSRYRSEADRVRDLWAQLGNVLELRTLADVDRLKPLMHPGKRIVVVGGGYIGL